jgi:hypothetical protein
VQGTIVAEQTWFGFPPEGDDAWTSHTRFRGTETWTNLDTGAAATDAFRYNVVHEWLGFVLQRTIQTGNGTNVKGGPPEGGRPYRLGRRGIRPGQFPRTLRPVSRFQRLDNGALRHDRQLRR